MEVDNDFQNEADEWRQNKKIDVRGRFMFDFGKIAKNAIKNVENAIKDAIEGEINGPPACPIPTGLIERFKCPANKENILTKMFSNENFLKNQNFTSKIQKLRTVS